MLTLRHVYTTLFFLGLFFVPFNDFEGLSFLGEYKNEAASYFFLLGFVALGIEVLIRGKINIPYHSMAFKILCLFALWTVISTIINLPTVLDSYYKQVSGPNRFIRQFISLSISIFCFLILYWSVIRTFTYTQILYYIRIAFTYSLIFATLYGVIEVAIVKLGMSQLTPILKLFEFFPFVNVNFNHTDRISSVAYESPALGNFLITIAAWMFSYIATGKSIWRFLPTLMVFFLMFFSGSRSALVVVNLQFVLFLTVLYFKKEYRVQLTKIVVSGFAIMTVILLFKSEIIIQTVEEKVESLNFSKKTEHDLSNRSRFGMQYASLQVFKKNPLVGVGLGQETYHKVYEYPFWATYNNWEFKYKYRSQKIKSFPSAYNLYTRLLAETGIIGIAIFLSLLFVCLKNSLRIWMKNKENGADILGLILLVSFTGLFLNWIQTDFFRQYGVWLCLAILMKIGYDQKKRQTVINHLE